MNSRKHTVALILLLLAICAAPVLNAQTTKTSSGEEFFIIASVDLAKSQLLLKRPTEVTTLLNISSQTKLLDAAGKPTQASDLRTGDTVWVIASGKGQDMTAGRVRKGPMTVAELHQRYLDYPEIK
jgi:hypothetical protein